MAEDAPQTREALRLELAAAKLRVAALESALSGQPRPQAPDPASAAAPKATPAPNAAPPPQEVPGGEDWYRRFFTEAGIGFFRSTATGQVLEVNPAHARMMGYESPEDLIGSVKDVSRQSYAQPRRRAENVRLIRSAKGVTRVENTYRRKDGSTFRGLLHAWTAQGPDGAPIIEGYVEDITERRQTESQLRESGQMLSQVLDAIPARVFWKDRDLRYLGCNRNFALDAGLDDPREIIGRDDCELGWCEQAKSYRNDDRKIIEGGISKIGYEENQTGPDGRRIWLRTSKIPLRDADGRVKGVLGTYDDITASKQAELELAKSRNFIRNILDSMTSAVIGIDEHLQVTHWNLSAQTMFGKNRSLVLGQPLLAVLPVLSGQMDKVETALRELRVMLAERVPVHVGGEDRMMHVQFYPLVASGLSGVVIRLDDVTEHVRVQEIMIQTEKMMSVGGLAAGMAHEINNPLSGIMQGAQVVLMRLTMDSPANLEAAREAGCDIHAVRDFLNKRGIVSLVESMRESAGRAAQIISSMLDFSRKSESTHAPANVNVLLDKALELCSADYDLKKKYDFRQFIIERDFYEDIPSIPCSVTQIQQVIMNLLRNSAQAMAGRPADAPTPRIILRTGLDGDMVRIEVEDNGSGMDENVRRKIFEPFYTTKPVGVGTGLGLSVSYFIVTSNHQGTIEVESWPGKGTRFVIRLPRYA